MSYNKSLETVLLSIIDGDKNTGQLVAARLFMVVARSTLHGKMSKHICCEYFLKKRCEIYSCIIRLTNACLLYVKYLS
jgi:hypothetical protein